MSGQRSAEHIVSEHPLLRGLVEALPPVHSSWSKEQRQHWINLAMSIVQVLYDDPEKCQETDDAKQQ